VAHKIHSTWPELAVLRRHPPPKAAMMETVVEQLGLLGITLDSSTAGTLATSIDKLRMEEGVPMETMLARMACITSLCSKPMELARYFCTGMFDIEDFHHFALNVPLYTHFTSPIRRYPDILVHRLLDAAITGRQPAWSSQQVQMQAERCNDQRLAAKRVGEASAELFLGLFIAECGPVTQEASVIQVLDHAVDVLVLQMGVVKRVYMDRLEAQEYKFRRVAGRTYIDLTWGEGRPKTSLTLMTRVTVVLMKGDRPFDFTAVIQAPEEGEEEILVE